MHDRLTGLLIVDDEDAQSLHFIQVFALYYRGFACHQWHRKPEGGSFASAAIDADSSVHELNQSLRNRKTKSCAAMGAGEGAVYLHKGLE